MKTDNNTYTLKADINNIYTLPEHNIFPLLMPLISQKQHWSSLYKSLWAHQTLQSTEPNRMAKPTALKHHKNPANLGKSSHYWSINSGPSVLSDSFTNHYTITDPSKFRSLIKTNLNERNNCVSSPWRNCSGREPLRRTCQLSPLRGSSKSLAISSMNMPREKMSACLPNLPSSSSGARYLGSPSMASFTSRFWIHKDNKFKQQFNTMTNNWFL